MKNVADKALGLLTNLKNPWAAVLDNLKMQKKPYVVHLYSGAAMELRPRSGDLFGFYEIMLRQDYLKGGQTLREGDTVIDVGANIGAFTVLAARIVGPKGRVIAIEPDKPTYQQLVRNIALNKLTNVVALNCALGETDGKGVLYSGAISLFSSMYSTVDGRETGSASQEMEVMTMETLLKSQNIERCDYLKMDCEGAEHQIVDSMSRAVAARFPQVTMEVHRVDGRDKASIRARMTDLGYAQSPTRRLEYYVLPAA